MTEAPYTNGRTGTLAWLGDLLDDQSLDPTDTLLLIALADHVDENDECFVGIERLARRARVSYTTAKRRLVDLEARGRVARVRRRKEGGNLSTYTTRLLRPTPGDNPVDPGDEPGTNVSPSTPHQSSPGRPLTRAHQGEPAEVPRVELPSKDLAGSRGSVRSSRVHLPVEEVLALRPPVDRDLNLAGVAQLRSQFGPQPNEPRPGPECSLALEHEA